MHRKTFFLSLAMGLTVGLGLGGAGMADTPAAVPVTIDNFVRAQSNLNMAGYVKKGGFGKFFHQREMVDADDQIVVRSNVDTLYSLVVLDLTTPPTIILPDPGTRFQSLECLSEEHSIQPTRYGPDYFTLTRDLIGSRYAFCLVRTFANPNDPDDMKAAHALQDQLGIEQANIGAFAVPDWDVQAVEALADLLQKVAQTRPSTRGYFGLKEDLNPLYWTLGAAAGWGGNPIDAAIYLNQVVTGNDGKTNYVLTVPKDVPIEAFWSVTLYDAKGYLPKTASGINSWNSVTAKPNADGTVTISFGGDGPNTLEIVDGWNYVVRLYRPKPALIDGQWRFPVAVPAQ